MSIAPWIAVQIGAREHYSVPRALHQADVLSLLLTDRWTEPDGLLCRILGRKRLGDRFHEELPGSRVQAPTLRSLYREAVQTVLFSNSATWPRTIDRNLTFQQWACRRLRELRLESVSLFAYSYAAADLFLFARERGWFMVLGQIDPGPVEERIVVAEHRRYPRLVSRWSPAPDDYWLNWHRELALADRVVVNSPWSYDCLVHEGLPRRKLALIPLVYTHPQAALPQTRPRREKHCFKLLFLGTIGLRKGVARLLEAMAILEGNADVHLTLAGPTELDPASWAHLGNTHWVGSQHRGEIRRLFQCADAMIIPTLSDGFAITQLEALRHGCPVIASMNCGRVVQDGINGWLLSDLEPETIAATVRRACDEAPSLRYPLAAPSFSLADLAAAFAALHPDIRS